MDTLVFLILFPLFTALIVLLAPAGMIRKTVSYSANLIIIIASVYLLADMYGSGPVFFSFNMHYIDIIIFASEMITGFFLIAIGIWRKKYSVTVLSVIQSAAVLYIHFFMAVNPVVEHSLFADQFSVIMALIIGIIGSLICLYSYGYMEEFHKHHADVRDSRRGFFFLMYLFLSAMFGIVFCNHLLWILFFWEITTLCSFLLIAYKMDEESENNAFKALVLNLAGGVAFSAAIIIFYNTTGELELDKLISSSKSAAIIPAVLIASAGLIKSAQLPFSSWLTAAMVAPTPVSALLHSSTMVKAGVYIIIRIAPVVHGTYAGAILSFIGAVTFIIASCIAVSRRNAKLVLAYSTIANLGLIVACAGIDSGMAVWSAIFLIIFHAVSKSLLFLCVGVVQNKTGSIDIEDMDYLVSRMPKIAAMMVIGISGMFLAPFGMLISKWMALKAFIDFNPVLAVILAYGSAVTLFFWSKWFGKIITIKHGLQEQEKNVSIGEWITLALLSLMTISVCLIFPLISSVLVEPYISGTGVDYPALLFSNVIIIIILMAALIIFIPAGILFYAYIYRGYRTAGTYYSGRNISDVSYIDAFGGENSSRLKNYYMENIFGERRLLPAGMVISMILIAVMFGVSLI